MQKRLLLLLIVLCCAAHLRAGDPPLSLTGTYLVGNSQPVYKKLSDVAAALNSLSNTVTGNVVFELDTDYDGTTGETFPINFKQFNSTDNWTVTIRPKAGVTMRTTSGDPGEGQPLIHFNGVDRLIFDGRAGGTGTITWLLRNECTTIAGQTILLQNNAQRNILTYLQLEGQTQFGTVQIGVSGSGMSDDNDDNLISYCTIRDRTDDSATGWPRAGIYTTGSRYNSGNTFDHNKIFNFFRAGTTAWGIRMETGTVGATITHNSIYQEQPILNGSGVILYGIHASETPTVQMRIEGNFIGGSAPECGGAPLTIVAGENAYCIMRGIFFGFTNSFYGDQNFCSNNTIRNIDLTVNATVYPTTGIFAGIYVCSKMEVINNTIGNPDGHDDIKITVGPGALFFRASMIMCESVKPAAITGNRMGGVTIAGRTGSATEASSLFGIFGSHTSNIDAMGPLAISDNIIGSTTIPDNIRVIGDSLPVSFSGIYFNHPIFLRCISNTIAGLKLGYAGTAIQNSVTGIQLSLSDSILVKNNLIAGLSSASQAVIPPPADENLPLSDFRGIDVNVKAPAEISGNTIRGLHLTGSDPLNATAGQVTGITAIRLITTSAGTVSNNKVYDLSSANDLGPFAATLVSGIRIEQKDGNAATLVCNNLVSLDNGGLSSNCEINGLRIKALGGSPVSKLYHNTVFIGGSNASSGKASGAVVAYSHPLSQPGSGTIFSIRNNLLVNGRTGGTGGHYMFRNATPGNNWTTSASDTNLLVTSDLSKVGRWGDTDLDTAQWKTTGGDRHSWFYTTLQLSPSALFTDAGSGDLRVNADAQKYIIRKGAASTGVGADYDSTVRSLVAPTIGAYEYSGPLNTTAPVITSHGGNAAVTLQVPENTITVTTITATDADAGATLVYSLVGGEDAAKFTINSSTGELSFVAAADFEMPGDANSDNAYIVIVQVSDGDSTAVQRFKIKVTDANDHAPVITSYNGNAAVTMQVAEHTTTVIATVTATDVDKSTTITYSLVNEEDAAQFGVNPSTGELSFITPPPDFERPRDTNGDNVYIVTVKASDSDSSATQRFKIKLTNVNDNAPVFTSHNGDAVVNLQVAENTITVDTVKAADGDSTTVTYSIVNEKDGALFSVSAAGVLSFITAPDFDHPADANADNQYIVSVKASDGTLSAVQQFFITVTDIDDNPPIATMTINVPENTVEVTQLEGTDDDAGSSVVFTMENTEDGALFWINPANGTLEFKTAPDFENPADADHDNLYLVSVKMTAGELITILRFKVKVTDTDGAAARATGRNATGPETQSTVVLQLEAGPEPGKAISVYPNPVTGKKFTLRIEGMAAGNYTLELYTMTGQLVCRQQLNHSGKLARYPVQLPGSLARGSYMLKLSGVHLQHTEKLLVE